MNLNKVFLIGRLTRDPQVKALPSGQSVANFGMATDRHFTDKSSQKQKQTEFHNIVLFGRLAEIASQYLTKGSLAMIEGRIQTRSWEDSSGNKRFRTEVIGERIQLGPRTNRGTTASSAGQEKIPEKEDIPIIREEKEINVEDIPF